MGGKKNSSGIQQGQSWRRRRPLFLSCTRTPSVRLQLSVCLSLNLHRVLVIDHQGSPTNFDAL